MMAHRSALAAMQVFRPLPTPPDRDLAFLARHALLVEATLSPKPGLVDCRGSGAHSDLSLQIMMRSALAIEPWFRRINNVACGAKPDLHLRVQLGILGRSAERAMLRATCGSNAHRGAIWALGLLVAAAAMHDSRPLSARAIAQRAGSLARLNDPFAPATVSHGSLATQRFGVPGAPGEAAAGFPHVVDYALPLLRSRRRDGVPEHIAQLDALLAIMTSLGDTCLLHRGGMAALRAVQENAAEILDAGGTATFPGRRHLARLDRRLQGMHVSPGGSADLLAAALFLDALERAPGEYRLLTTHSGTAYGTF
jgi:triphosphoribosyl-dephospho-CoA synthase